MDTDRDLYQILQVDPAAEQEVVQAAFKRLALKYHPDKNPAPDAHRRMQERNDAILIISDPVQRGQRIGRRWGKKKSRRSAWRRSGPLPGGCRAARGSGRLRRRARTGG